MVTNLICGFASAFDVIDFFGFIGITIAAAIVAATLKKGLKMAHKLGIKSIIVIIFWALTGIIMFYDAFVC